MLDYLFHSLPVLGAILFWAIRLEVKIAKVQTDLTWLKKELPQCQQTSVDPTP